LPIANGEKAVKLGLSYAHLSCPGVNWNEGKTV
jgi:hypothetical protein